jgi:hypothetical protein
MARGEKGFAEVAGDDFFRIPDGGEMGAFVPAGKYIDVRRYIAIKSVVSGWSRVACILQERLEQFGDAGGVHKGHPIVDGWQQILNRGVTRGTRG